MQQPRLTQAFAWYARLTADHASGAYNERSGVPILREALGDNAPRLWGILQVLHVKGEVAVDDCYTPEERAVLTSYTRSRNLIRLFRLGLVERCRKVEQQPNRGYRYRLSRLGEMVMEAKRDEPSATHD